MRIAFAMVGFAVVHHHVGVDERQVLVQRHFQQTGREAHFERRGPQDEVGVDDGPVHVEAGCIPIGALAGRLDPAAPAADAVAQGQVAQVELGEAVAFAFQRSLHLRQVGIESGWGGIAVQDGDFHFFCHFCGTFPALICSITFSAHSRAGAHRADAVIEGQHPEEVLPG